MEEIVNWDNRINQRILRDSTSWEEPNTMIEDETRSGKVKRRLYHSAEKRRFSVGMRFTMAEYVAFRDWFTNDLRKGVFHFRFPQIDSVDKTIMKEYRFTKDGFPRYNNISGQIINVTMEWEEV